MKKVLLCIVGAAIIVLAAVNVNLALNSGSNANLTLANIASLAKGEYSCGSCYFCVTGWGVGCLLDPDNNRKGFFSEEYECTGMIWNGSFFEHCIGTETECRWDWGFGACQTSLCRC